MSRNIADVVIVGAGIAGNSAAYYCAKKGLKVIVLEEEMIGHGGSSRNGGGARVSGRDIREMPLAIFATQNIWPFLKDELGVDPEYHQKGYLVCGYNEEHKKGIEKRIIDAAKMGIKMELLEGDEVKRKCKYVSERVTVAGWTPTDGTANPLTATLGFYKRARELGVQFITGEKAVKINLCNGRARQVVTEKGNLYEGGKIIISAGYGGRKLLNTVGLDLPLFKRLVEVIVTEPIPFMFEHMIGGMSGFYGHQTEHGSFVFGDNSGRENCMAELEGIPSTSYNPAVICSHIGIDIPKLKEAKIIRSWAGWIDMSHDGVPILGNLEEVPDLVVDIGSTGHGFCPGPAVGFTLAELANGDKPTVDISKLAYERFDMAKKQPQYY